MLNFKTDLIREQWETGLIHASLLIVAYAFAAYLHDEFGVHAVITSLFRKNDDGVHGDWRGVDFRANTLDHNQQISADNWLNSHFEYDDRQKYKVCLLHGTGKHIHFHLQVSWKGNAVWKRIYTQKPLPGKGEVSD